VYEWSWKMPKRDGRGNGRGYGRGQGRGYGRGNNNNSHNVTDRYYSPEEWNTLSQEQQQRVRELRADRDRRRGIEVVGTQRNIRQRTETHEVPPSEANTAPTANNQGSSQGQNSTGIGATMSQRRPANNNRNSV
jgi:hypothetical protein